MSPPEKQKEGRERDSKNTGKKSRDIKERSTDIDFLPICRTLKNIKKQNWVKHLLKQM